MHNHEIPRYPRFRAIRLSDRAVFQDFFRHSPPDISEYTFTNLFTWQHYYNFSWCLWDDCICILSEPTEGTPFFMPPLGAAGSHQRCLALLQHLKERGITPSIQRVPETMAREFSAFSDRVAISPDRDNADYVYRTEDLIRLEGNRYHGKRNHINKFKKNYTYQYSPLTPELVGPCLELLTEWCDIKHCEQVPGLLGEEHALSEALRNMDSLDFRGGVIHCNGTVEAFALGEKLNPHTAVIHMEKANPSLEGLYPLINQEFCAKEWADTIYINREQDLGEEGLRKAKLSYHPHHLNNKYTLTLRDSQGEEE